jgi:hypothetical protein
VWAPDGDEAFDDWSHVLQFDVGGRVRLIGFRSNERGYHHDERTLADVWIDEGLFYRVLKQWRDAFLAEWECAPKIKEAEDGAEKTTSLAVKITDIEMLRDGGTILFKLSEVPKAGDYRLQTPFLGEPRVVFFNNRALQLGSTEEEELAGQLEVWLRQQLTEKNQKGIEALDSLTEWRNLPRDLMAIIPIHRIRTVVRCLRSRNPQPSGV